MKHYERIWVEKRQEASVVQQLSADLQVSEVLARLLINRGLCTAAAAETFLDPRLERLLDPFGLWGMEPAVKRIRRAMEARESIWIYGDYDVDGITAVSLLCRFFKWMGHPVRYYIPDRLEEGYGISEEGIRRVRGMGCDLLISVDCGVTAVRQVQQARDLGMDVIITDHHEPHELLPEAVAVINPKQLPCGYPEKSLSGVGVAFKLAQAIAPEFLGDPVAGDLLQIAALGTVADIVPMTGENRILVKHGIDALRRSPVVGASALMRAAGVDPAKVSTGHIGFMLAPRINAAGRIDAPQKGVELLLTEDPEEADLLAGELSALNEERQRMEREIFEAAVASLESQPDFKEQRVLVIAGAGWHPGVIGIVASRIVERYYRPCILLNLEDGKAKGSARSIEGFDLFEALTHCQELFIKFGGHEMAAGMTLEASNVPLLRERLNAYAREHLAEELLIPRIHGECQLTPRHLHFSLLDDLDRLEPFGPGNPKPVFLYRGLTIDQRRLLGKNKEHVKLVTHDGNRVFEAIGFRWANPERLQPGHRVDLAFVLERNSFNGVESLQMQMRDSRLRGWRHYVESPSFRPYWGVFWNACASLRGEEGTAEIRALAGRAEPVASPGLTQGEEPRTILIWSPEGYETLLGALLDLPAAERPEISYGRPRAERPGPRIVVCPELSAYRPLQDSVVALWDIPPEEALMNWAADRCKNQAFHYNDTVGASLRWVFDQLVPSKEQLADVYREVRQGRMKPILPESYLEDSADPLQLLKLEVKLWILEMNGFIRRETEAYRVAETTGERISIVDSDPYRFLLKLRAVAAQMEKTMITQEAYP